MLSERAGLAVQMVLELLAELLHKGQRGHGRRIAQRAKRPAQHVLGKILNVVYVLRRSKAEVEASDRLLQPVGAFAAGNAPAAALVLIEADGPQRKLDDAGPVVEH